MTISPIDASPAGGMDGLARARRNALLLAAAMATAGAAAPISISMGGLAGHYLLGPDKSLATAPVTGFNVGVAVGALAAAWLMRRVGRRRGLMAGAVLPALGGAVATIALFRGSFWLFACALVLVGFGNAFVQQYRFAATDAAPAAFKPQAISWVLVGGVFSAIIGPQTVILTREAFAPVMFAGSFAALLPLAGIGIAILAFLRMPERESAVDDVSHGSPARPLATIVADRRFLTALVCGVSAFALMTFMMTGAPLAMVGCGHSTDMATLGIQWHVMAMFAPSFVTGRLIARFGKEPVVAAGFVILIACAAVAQMGLELWNFWLSLVLLGVGWNFGFIGATAMVTDCYRPSEKNKVEGFHDAVLFALVAFASLASGQTLNAFGWNALTLATYPVAALCLILLFLQVTLERSKTHRPAG